MLRFRKFLSVCGAAALLLGVGMNLRHSLNDYGMGTNSLSIFALAQSSSSSGSGSGSSSGSGPFWTLKQTKTDCYKIAGDVTFDVSAGTGMVSTGASMSDGTKIFFQGILWDCFDGWNPFCTEDCRGVL